jgi:E3 ubiquitin-protein ligase TRIP12
MGGGTQAVMKCDHGYTSSSQPLCDLREVLCELGPTDRRCFLRFVTGSPRLPPGGLGALSPQLTVVRKHPSSQSSGATLGSSPAGESAMAATAADHDLPSVMTCANYLKLPPYSCKPVLKERLLYAIREGSASFDLS